MTLLLLAAIEAKADAQGVGEEARTRPPDSVIARMKANATASPIVPSEARADSAGRGASARAIAAFRIGNAAALRHAIERSADQSVRAFVINDLAASGVRVSGVETALAHTSDPGARAALILALGEFPTPVSAATLRRVASVFESDPDAEVHSSSEWLLLKNRQRLPNVARARSGAWGVNTIGQTMVTIQPQHSFTMGAPAGESRRDSSERQHKILVPRAFAIATREVTVAEFQRFLRERGATERWKSAVRERWRRLPDTTNFFAHADWPQFAVTWFEAAQFCNWLSEKAGIPKAEWVYPDSIADGMRLPSDYLHRTGYRLPTEAEWEFAARANTTTAHFFGDGVALLDRYAIWLANSGLHGWPTSTRKPNQFGLFDIYGNGWEWVQSRWVDFPDAASTGIDKEDETLIVSYDTPRVRRGGSWSYDRETTRSAHRGAVGGYRPGDRRDSVGFRVARTVR